MNNYRRILLCGLAAFAIGVMAWVYQGMVGLNVTNLSNSFPWGNYVASFEFFIGVAAGGLLVFSLAYVLKGNELRPLAPIAAATALAGGVAAVLAILSDMGMASRLYRVLITPNLMSPMLWEMMMVAIFLVVAVLAVFFQLTKKENSEALHKKVAYVALPVSLTMPLIAALLFATQPSHDWWSSVMFVVDSMVATFALGGSVVFLFSLLYFGKKNMQENEKAYTRIGRIVIICLVAHLFVTLLELLPFIGSQVPANQQLISLLFGKYGGLFVLEFIVSIGAIAIYGTKKYAGQFWFSFGAGIAVVLGGFVHRLLVLAPAFNTYGLTLDVGGNLWPYPIATGTFTEGSSSFETFWSYVPSFTEWVLMLLPVGAALVLIGILFNKIHEKGNKVL
ncbi:MAG: polysulfide reductase NrfD [Peptococcaceae bacterium]|nr:polysulfide reductase NrfD [Peptococcaceae bacterium]